MIKNFEEVKKQLEGLSEVVNKFKSEAVQLRIVDLVFAGGNVPPAVDATEEPAVTPARRRAGKRRKAVATSTTPGKAVSKKARTSSAGPKPLLVKFINDGFFNQKRTIGAVVEHCDNGAHPYKSTDLSGPLAALVRENTLERKKNAEGQYEYVKK